MIEDENKIPPVIKPQQNVSKVQKVVNLIGNIVFRGLAKWALKFKAERGRLPDITSPDPWEKRMAEGVAYLAKKKAEAGNE